MEVLKRANRPETYISFLHIYKTTWGTAADICLVRESVANSSISKFVGHKLQLVIPKGMERNELGGVPVIKVAGHVGDGHPKDQHSEWEAYEGIDREIALAAMKPWGFKLIEFTN
ncbi:hypothetical protein [Umezakia ovalisporum]|uniref:Uncharacterized protein n=2 Tax=Umezakia ovalisporum TaxID=75695 RepID=A0AA43KG63_9CYAN|nr:hypothetical protein [Umezakia ovalisporum]MBI1240555.1 hypothetical protein [Nostoc sp. RI_552]MDH6055550.1 hypothetical protein [Umezakia ovalisporum FSS-43]MDH6065232.1 hypothetical protein [Umezakia ovalisporum FSS-62]MDH6067081.1 hypothetical protein [Umezakia ovalisporum APH033B]MDH6070066.1 hypothetical protein [Umezakia ovalisporum CobakiLakeA]